MRRTARWVLVLGIFAAMFVVVAVLAALSVGTAPHVPGRALLWVKLGPDMAEEDPRSSFERALGRPSLTLRDTVRVLRHAGDDRRVEAVVVELRGFGGGWAMAQELRAELVRLRDGGKPLFAYLEMGESLDYYLASAAERVVLPPSGALMVTGLLADVPFYRGTLSKIGVEADLEHIGAYKSASDVWTRESMSDAQREATNTILDGIYDAVLSDVAKSRSLDRSAVGRAVDEGFLTAPRARELGLVDDLSYRDELLEQIEKRLGHGASRIRATVYAESVPEPRGGAKIGLVYVTGTIVSGRSSVDPLAGSTAGSETIAEALRKVREDSAIRAVVLRVDSPGGSGLASDVIWREVELTRDKKPVVVSMGDVAASGGYYVSMGADAIVAQPSTLTGSIGVISGKFALRGLYDWAGLHREQIKRGANADLFTDYQTFTDAQRALIRGQMEAFYRDFLRKAAAGRKTTDAEIDAVGQGRVWTGAQARDRKLVDELGGLDRAVEIAKDKAGIPQGRGVRIEVYPRPKGLLDSIFSTEPEDASARRALAGVIPSPLRGIVTRWSVLDRLAGEPVLLLEETLVGAR